MCGLLGFSGKVDIYELIHQIRRRGPDALGFAWWREDENEWDLSHYLTDSWPERKVRSWVDPAIRWGVAHSRLATSGNGGIKDAQPLQVQDMVFAHNGTVYAHERLAETHNLPLATGNDSEALAQLFYFYRDPEEVRQILLAHQGQTPHAWIAATGRKMWLASWGQPLWVMEGHHGKAAASWRVPGARLMRSGEVLEWESPYGGATQ